MKKRISTITWNNGMSVGIPEIDMDHKRFITLVNAFNESISGRMAVAEVKKRLQDILDDAVEHFAQEERLFKEWGYPDADDHLHLHAQLIDVLAYIKSQISYGYGAEWIIAGLKIKELLINHIQKEDMKYAEFYRNSRGALQALSEVGAPPYAPQK